MLRLKSLAYGKLSSIATIFSYKSKNAAKVNI